MNHYVIIKFYNIIIYNINFFIYYKILLINLEIELKILYKFKFINIVN